jgi:outer membrane protein, multidrug efflux system
MNKRLLMVACALALAACATESKLTPSASTTTIPELAPGAGAQVRDLTIDRWWSLFGDPVLDRLMEEALARNADLETAVARVREAQATLDVVRAAQSFTVDANASSSRSQISEVSSMPVPPGVNRVSNRHRVSLDAAYDLDLWGRLSSTSAAARSQLLASEWARSAVEWGLTARVAQSYFELGAADRQIELTEQVRSVRQRALDARRREYAAGAGSELDLRRAEAELTGSEAQLASLARQRAGLERALILLLGRTPAEIVNGGLQRSALNEIGPLEAVLPSGPTSNLLVRRPDLRQAEAQLAAANYSIEAARAATLPSARLSGSLGSDAKSLADLFSGPAAIWSVAGGLAQPIIDGGRLRAKVREERARAEQSLAGYRKTVAGAVLEVREAYSALDLTQQEYQAQRARVVSLARAHDLAERGYAIGALGYLDLLDAERNWHQARLDQVGAYRDRLISQVAAFKALGGGYIHQGSTL